MPPRTYTQLVADIKKAAKLLANPNLRTRARDDLYRELNVKIAKLTNSTDADAKKAKAELKDVMRDVNMQLAKVDQMSDLLSGFGSDSGLDEEADKLLKKAREEAILEQLASLPPVPTHDPNLAATRKGKTSDTTPAKSPAQAPKAPPAKKSEHPSASRVTSKMSAPAKATSTANVKKTTTVSSAERAKLEKQRDKLGDAIKEKQRKLNEARGAVGRVNAIVQRMKDIQAELRKRLASQREARLERQAARKDSNTSSKSRRGP